MRQAAQIGDNIFGQVDAFSQRFLAPFEIDDRVIVRHARGRVAGLLLRVEPRRTLVLDSGDVLPAKGMPAEPREVQTQLLGCGTNEVFENDAVIQSFAAHLKDITVPLGVRWLKSAVLLNEVAQRNRPDGAFAFRHVGVAAIVTLLYVNETTDKVNRAPLQSEHFRDTHPC